MSVRTPEKLPVLVDELLMHGFGVEIVENDHGSYGIALIVDGWYTDRRNSWGLDAEGVLGHWQGVLDSIKTALAAEADR